MNYDDFDSFQNQIVLTGIGVNTTNLHIGGLEDDDNVNRLQRISKKDEEVPFIPGSSLKGVFRSELERHARGMGLNVCNSTEVNGICSPESNNFCVICGIFGGAGLAAHLRIEDALPVEAVTTQLKPQVAIDRVTGTVSGGGYFLTEVVNPFQQFEVKMIIENIELIDVSKEDSRSTLIKLLIRQLIDGNIAVGGKTTSGMGRIKLDNIILNIRSLNDDFSFTEKKYTCQIQAGALKFTKLEE